MDSQKLFNWIQLLTGIAVLAGLGLVVWELQQTRLYTRTNLIVSDFEKTFQKDLTLMGENAASIQVKACLEPNSLSQEDIGVAWALVSRRMGQIEAVLYQEQIAEVGTPAEVIAKNRLRIYLGYPLGRWDFETRRANWVPEIRAIAEAVVDEGEVIPCQEFWGRLTTDLEKGAL